MVVALLLLATASANIFSRPSLVTLLPKPAERELTAAPTTTTTTVTQEETVAKFQWPKFENKLPYFWGCAAAGAVSTAITHSAVFPLDVLKTKMQADASLAGLSASRALRRILQRDGKSNFLAGFSANAVGYFSQGAIKFGLYETGKHFFTSRLAEQNPDVDTTRWRVPIWIASSALAEVVACLALCPMEATKIRLVTNPGYAGNAFVATRRIVGEEGARALWRGVWPIMIRQVPYTVAKLAGYEALSLFLGGGLAAGVVAGAAAAAVSQPGDVILSKLCGGSAVARIETCYLSAGAVVRELSISQLFVGLTPRATMCAVICAGQFFLYEALRPPKPSLVATPPDR